MDKQQIFRIITVTATSFIAILVVALIVNLIKLSNLNKRKEELAAQLAAINASIEQVDGEIGYITTDEYVDQYAREYLDMQGKDDEAFTGKEKD